MVADKVMMPADLKRLHKYMVEVEHIEVISDEMRAVVESEWPELAHKPPPKELHRIPPCSCLTLREEYRPR